VNPRTLFPSPILPHHACRAPPYRRTPDRGWRTKHRHSESSVPTSFLFRGTPLGGLHQGTTLLTRSATAHPRFAKCPPPLSPTTLVCPIFSEGRSRAQLKALTHFLRW